MKKTIFAALIVAATVTPSQAAPGPTKRDVCSYIGSPLGPNAPYRTLREQVRYYVSNWLGCGII